MKLYYFIKDNQRLGPLPLDQLLQNGLQPSTLVWTDGLTDWITADQVAELQPLFAPAQPVAPVPPAQPVMPEAPVQPEATVQPTAPVQPEAPQPAAPQYQQPQAVPQPQYQQPAQPQYQQPAQPQYQQPAQPQYQQPAQPQYQQPAQPQYQQPAQPQYQQPAQPQYQQPYQQPQYQQPYQQPAVGGQNLQNIFKIILYVLLGLSALGGLITFIGAFSFFGGFFKMPLLGLCQILSSAAVIGISVMSIMRMAKNEKFAFLTIAYFALGFILNLLGLIISSRYGGGVFSFMIGLAGLAVAVLASIPTDKIGDVNSYKNLLPEATQIDYVLLGIYALLSIISLIYLIIAL